ncbi:aldo/keto reductase [uncultured Clostridium sp.]|uniref:aldo/keto reductase n=1 Tax=uncultured Clostridium sp. TaxID=59620 RepID=UPI0034212E55
MFFIYETLIVKNQLGFLFYYVAWLWNKGVTSPIVGITKEKYLDDFIGALDVKLSKEDMEYLEEKYAPHNIVGHN